MPDPQSLRVLVVDDSDANRRVAEALVRGSGAAAAGVAGGADALERLAAEPFDLVLLDRLMPGLDGPAVAREIRRREAVTGQGPIQIVGMTASVLPEDRQLLLEAGMDDVLAKPLLADEVAAVLAPHADRLPRRGLPILPPAR